MISYLDILDKMREVADGISTIHHFQNGPVSEWDHAKHNATQYPLLMADCQSVTFDEGLATYEFTVAIGDLLFEDESNRDRVFNDTLLSLQDFLNHFVHSEAENGAEGFVVQRPLACTPFTERLDNSLTGWEVSMEIEVAETNDLCASS